MTDTYIRITRKDGTIVKARKIWAIEDGIGAEDLDGDRLLIKTDAIWKSEVVTLESTVSHD